MPTFDQELEDQALDDRRVEPGFLEAVDGPRDRTRSCRSSSRLGRAAKGLKGSRQRSPFRMSRRFMTRHHARVRRGMGIPRNPRSRTRRRQSGSMPSGSHRAVRPVGRRSGRPSGGSSIRTDASRRPGRLERDHPAVLGQQAADAIGPFDQTDAAAAPVVGDAEVFEGLRTLAADRRRSGRSAGGLRTRGSRRTWGSRSPPDRPRALRRSARTSRVLPAPSGPTRPMTTPGSTSSAMARPSRAVSSSESRSTVSVLPVSVHVHGGSSTGAEMIEAHGLDRSLPGHRGPRSRKPGASVTAPTR